MADLSGSHSLDIGLPRALSMLSKTIKGRPRRRCASFSPTGRSRA